MIVLARRLAAIAVLPVLAVSAPASASDPGPALRERERGRIATVASDTGLSLRERERGRVATVAALRAIHPDGSDIPVPPDPAHSGTGGGPLSAADRDFVIKVRLAGLWEIPAGNLAQERSRDPRIVTIGREIAAQHVVLDRLDRAAARTLGIELPNQPNGDQLGWLAEMRAAATPAQFDQVFIDRLRAAHGKIFPVIATIRADTRNDTVRRLAQQANQFVMTHMTLLEGSGLVDYGTLPSAPPPAANGPGPVPVDHHMLATAGGAPASDRSFLVVVLAGALLAGVVTTIRILRNARERSPHA